MSNTLLKVDNLHVYYGSIHAIKGVSFKAVSYTHLSRPGMGIRFISPRLMERMTSR